MVGRIALENMHQLFLEALRHREQEIVPYLAIIGPALGGFVWLLSATDRADVFIVGTIGVLLLLLFGAIYSLALGYNYRYITLELAKLEKVLGITFAMLEGWPKSPKEFLKRYKIFRCIPWCTPPEVIKVFWEAFLFAIVGVSAATSHFKPKVVDPALPIPATPFCVGAVCLAAAWLIFPCWFGWKLRRQIKKEMTKWDDLPLLNRVET